MLEGKIVTDKELQETLEKYKKSHEQISQKINELSSQQLQLAGAILAVTDQLNNLSKTTYQIKQKKDAK